MYFGLDSFLLCCMHSTQWEIASAAARWTPFLPLPFHCVESTEATSGFHSLLTFFLVGSFHGDNVQRLQLINAVSSGSYLPTPPLYTHPLLSHPTAPNIQQFWQGSSSQRFRWDPVTTLEFGTCLTLSIMYSSMLLCHEVLLSFSSVQSDVQTLTYPSLPLPKHQFFFSSIQVFGMMFQGCCHCFATLIRSYHVPPCPISTPKTTST